MDFTNLERYRIGGTTNNMQLSIPIPKTPGNRYYRLSPNEKAHPRHFVMGERVMEIEATPDIQARQKHPPGSPLTVCPYSGIAAEDAEFTHPEDREAAVELATHAVMTDLSNMLEGLFKGMETKSRGGFLSLSIETKSNPPPPKPRFRRKDLMREMVCDHCGRDYGVFALGLFCPDCGAPNVAQHFARERDLVAKQVAVANAQTETDEELAYRLLGNAHEDVLTGFEATLKTVYRFAMTRGGGEAPRTRNDFQNIEKGEKRFAEIGLTPFAALTPEERELLDLNIQKRHIIGHNLGVVDEKYADQQDDVKLGETAQIIGNDILVFGDLAQKIVNVLDNWLVTAEIAAPVVIPSPAPKSPPAPVDPDITNAQELNLNTLTYRLAKFIAQESKTGLSELVDEDPIIAAFADVDTKALNRAFAELEHDHYIKTTGYSNQIIPSVCLCVGFFETFDPLVMGTDPAKDAAALAKILAARDEDAVDSQKLHEDSGWDLRRFNPALTTLLGRLGGPKTDAGMGDYSSDHFFLTDTDRVALDRYIRRMAQ